MVNPGNSALSFPHYEMHGPHSSNDNWILSHLWTCLNCYLFQMTSSFCSGICKPFSKTFQKCISPHTFSLAFFNHLHFMYMKFGVCHGLGVIEGCGCYLRLGPQLLVGSRTFGRQALWEILKSSRMCPQGVVSATLLHFLTQQVTIVSCMCFQHHHPPQSSADLGLCRQHALEHPGLREAGHFSLSSAIEVYVTVLTQADKGSVFLPFVLLSPNR